MQNAMYIIEIYRHAGTWCFTDDKRGLVHEPFVLGIPEFIDQVINLLSLGELNRTYKVIFSEKIFPAYQGCLSFKETEHGGAWYSLSVLNQDAKNNENGRGWLCPATLKFFEYFPPEIYFKLEALKA